mmetsp:Transcript_54169/g.106998  ORF Transcript_54169/g.106998 Transcript_54169/m.106998 type:complete len:689 (-) Transcript_54169:133-2199(-)
MISNARRIFTKTLQSGRNLHAVPKKWKVQSNIPAAAVAQQANEGSREKTSLGFALLSLLALGCSLGTSFAEKATDESSSIEKEKFSTIVVGGGTAGCTVAYLTAKWMQDNHIPGSVLLVDKGVHFFDAKEGPDPLMISWFENWGVYGDAHPALRDDGTAYPVTASDHRGIGGCGTHDTRITFQPTPSTLRRLAGMMGWSEQRLQSYYQAALNLMPITPAVPKDQPEDFYNALMTAVPADQTRAEGDYHNTNVTENALAMAALAAYPNEIRWTSAYFLHDSVRPSNLRVVTDATVEKLLLEENGDGVSTRGVQLLIGQGSDARTVKVELDKDGEVALTGGAFGATSVLQRSGVGPKGVLDAAGVDKVFVDNPEVGHGVDHIEIAVLYEWLDHWNVPGTNAPPRGGIMGWPLIAFLNFPANHRELFPSTEEPHSAFMMGHFGAGYAEPYTDFPTVVCTPNCIRPDMSAGFRAQILSTRPADSLRVVHADQSADWAAIAKGVLSTVNMMEHLREKGLVGNRLQPDFDLKPELLVEWIKENHFTAFHWACTCQAGVRGRVADQRFRVRNAPLTADVSAAALASADDKPDGRYKGVIQNLLVGSAAALPELPDANPHLTITAFSVALAEELVKTQAERRRCAYQSPSELRRAVTEVYRAGGGVTVREPGQEYPNLSRVAAEHYKAWQEAHKEK